MKHFLIAALFIVSLNSLGAAEPDWSEATNGVKARLSLERAKDSPFLKIFLEFQNTSDVAGMKEVRFTPDTLLVRVTDETGAPLEKANYPYDGTAPTWKPLQLPYESTIKVRISFPGLGYQPTRDRTIIDLGPVQSWSIPDDGKVYYLSGTLTIPAKEGDHPHFDWHGTLNLPKIRIPTK